MANNAEIIQFMQEGHTLSEFADKLLQCATIVRNKMNAGSREIQDDLFNIAYYDAMAGACAVDKTNEQKLQEYRNKRRMTDEFLIIMEIGSNGRYKRV